MSTLTESPPWRSLQEHAEALRRTTLLDLFRQDPLRAEHLTCEAAGLYLDYSKQRVSRDTLERLSRLADARDLAGAVERMFSGAAVNATEGRPALHVALRNLSARAIRVRGEDVMPRVRAVLERVGALAETLRSGQWRGATGEPVTDVVNIGIGGSDLGPRFVCDALAPYRGPVRVHFISNADGAPLADLCQRLRPQTTMFVVTSKTFTTLETSLNAAAARAWLLPAVGGSGLARHFVAVTANAAEAARLGVPQEQVLEFWDWVGGRYSLWSAVGLTIAVGIGAQRHRELLSGAHAMDEHFRLAERSRNMPAVLGLLGVWNSGFLEGASHVVVPYAERLALLPEWLQQLELESNGKGVDLDGQAVDYRTTPVLWGGVGTNAQHSFFQLLHHGPSIHPVDLILVAEADHALADQHRALLVNALGQGAALLRGKGAQRVRQELEAAGLSGAELEAAVPHRVYRGDRPSNTLVVPRLDPYHLGALLALYEHRTYVQSVLWNVNAFDQFGVQLGKQAAERVMEAFDRGDFGPDEKRLDPSTRRLVLRIRAALEKKKR